LPILDPENSGNVVNGRLTSRFQELTPEEREREIKLAAEDADKTFQQIDKSLLFNNQNWQVS
jgi:hypothetical protein